MASLKRISGIVLCVFAILLMSHNADAVSPVYDLSNFDNVYTYNNTFDCSYNNTSIDVNKTSVWVCPIHAGNSLNSIITSGNVTVEEGDIIDFPILIYSNGSASLANSLKFEWLAARSGFSLIDIRLENNNYQSVFGENTSLIPTGYTINQIWVFTLRANRNMTTQIGFGSGTYPFMTYITEDVSGYYVIFRMGDVKVWRNMGSQENKEQAEATQDAADEASSSGSSSEASAEAATSSLISVIGGFVNVLTSAQPTNCKINANLNHIDMGQLDLCANPVPSYIQIIGSIILICAAIPLAIVLFNRFIGLFRSFQG